MVLLGQLQTVDVEAAVSVGLCRRLASRRGESLDAALDIGPMLI